MEGPVCDAALPLAAGLFLSFELTFFSRTTWELAPAGRGRRAFRETYKTKSARRAAGSWGGAGVTVRRNALRTCPGAGS
jgi:hypothetical protein